jgi:hypothetical protein
MVKLGGAAIPNSIVSILDVEPAARTAAQSAELTTFLQTQFANPATQEKAALAAVREWARLAAR